MITTKLSATGFRTAVAAAVRAPSLHNSQPWRFRLRDGTVEVLADPTRRLPASDPSGWAMRVACGAATYNLQLALVVQGTPGEVHVRPEPADRDLIARIVPGPAREPTLRERDLYAAISRRSSHRAPFWPDPVPASARVELIAAARAEGAWLDLIPGLPALRAVAEIAKAADRALRRDPGYRAELAAWTRHGYAADGVPAWAGGPRPRPQDLLPVRHVGGRPHVPDHDGPPEPLLAVLGTQRDTATDQIRAGMALQRVLLTATAAGLAVSMVSQPIEVDSAREQLRLALRRFGPPQMLLRIGYGDPSPPTPRRGPEAVIVED